MMRFCRQTLLVTANEFADALRSRRALVVLVLYVAAAVLTTNSSINLLQRIGAELGDVLQLESSGRAGAVSSAIWNSPRFRRLVIRTAGDDTLVDDLLGTPPIVLIYGALAFFYTPLLTVLIASTRVAEEVAAGSARYALIRTSRASWSCGKFLGQAGLAGLAILLGGIGAWIVALIRMAAEEGPGLASGMILTAGRAWLYALVYVGLATGLSHWTRAPGRATAMALVGLLALSVLSWMSELWYGRSWRELWHLVHMLTPQRDRLDLWRWAPSRFLPAAAHLVALSWLYLMGGYAVLRRRDL